MYVFSTSIGGENGAGGGIGGVGCGDCCLNNVFKENLGNQQKIFPKSIKKYLFFYSNTPAESRSSPSFLIK